MSFSGPSNYQSPAQQLATAVNPLVALGRFLCKWVLSRPLKPFLWSLPALLGSIVVVAMLLLGQQQASEVVDVYDALAREKFAAEDFVAAQLYLEKVTQLDGQNLRRMYNLGLVVARRGHRKRATQIMGRLAPEHKSHYPAAHVWMANRIARNPSDTTQTERLRHHLTSALVDSPYRLPLAQQLDTLEWLARIELANQRIDDAVSYLLRGFASDPRFGIALARAYVLQKDKSRALTTANTAIRLYEQKLKMNPRDLEARRHLAAFAAFNEEFPKGEKLLLEGFQLAGITESQQAELRSELGMFRMTWEAHLARTGPTDWRKRLDLLNRALELIPDNRLLFNRFAQLIAGSPDVIQEVVKAMERQLAAGQQTAIAHWVLGTALIRLNNAKSAEHHLRLAIATDAKMGVAANNLAWLLGHQKHPRLDEALRLIEIAIKALPDHPEVRETRGQILFRRGEWRKAAVDLEFALARVADPSPVHAALAQIYQKLGQPALAESHQQLASEKQLLTR